MEKREFKVGDKVKIPKTKSKGLMTSLENCNAIQNAKRLNQDYLYINRIIEDEYDLGAELGEFDSVFGIQDLEHYEEEEIVLPKCWFVLYNTQEEFDIINKFYGKDWIYYNNKNLHGYHNNGDNQVHNDNWVGNHTIKEKLLKNGYIQITFEQFQKYIKQVTMEKEIEGYVLIKEYPGSKGLGYFEKYTTGELNKYPEFWKPVYKEEKQTIQMYSSNKGMFEIEVVDGKAYYRPENKELSKQWIASIIDVFDNKVYGLLVVPYTISAQIKEVKVGCMEGTIREDWEKVYKLLK